jgi:hypothetical protein
VLGRPGELSRRVAVTLRRGSAAGWFVAGAAWADVRVPAVVPFTVTVWNDVPPPRVGRQCLLTIC